MFFTIECNEEMWTEADARAIRNPVYANSRRGRAANQLGCLGEVAAEHWMCRNDILFKNETYLTTHDYRLPCGITIDVKTKDRTVPPRPAYDCSVPEYNHQHQLPDYYLFVSLQRDKTFGKSLDIRRYKYAHVLGAITLANLESNGKVWRAGEVDPANGTRFWTSCINVRINQLEPLKHVAARWLSPQRTAGAPG
ncbi:hypothetical protein [Massilia litorea]|uniref:Uncharacterized protein n=1 Tax=Massilia litorea TaxID=2769491 RepID=A0A7L9U5W3_9BURK|nr:hypothetical protein [Massilia litorea]QOL50240.1 hypothetical protein LPB04_02690 [Massilia litorea]